MNDLLVQCQICGEKFKRSEIEKWRYYNGELYCTAHPGVLEWYEGALRIAEEMLKHSEFQRGREKITHK